MKTKKGRCHVSGVRDAVWRHNVRFFSWEPRLGIIGHHSASFGIIGAFASKLSCCARNPPRPNSRQAGAEPRFKLCDFRFGHARVPWTHKTAPCHFPPAAYRLPPTAVRAASMMAVVE
jgi:hypothetical protein